MVKTSQITDEDKLSSLIISSLKKIVGKYDSHAEIILFGSRARGDFNSESDWDFLVLTEIAADDDLKDNIRREVLYEIEFKTGHHVAAIFHNKKVWQQNYHVTNLFKSIQEEGIVV